MPKITRAARRNQAQGIDMSRQPPLPPGLPPRPPPPGPPLNSRSNSRSGDYAYMGGDARGRDSYVPAPRSNDNQYTPREPRDVFQFGGGQVYRPNYDQRPQSPPRHSYAPGTSRNNDSYRDSYGYGGNAPGDNRSHYQAPRNDFEFRYDAPPGINYDAYDNSRHRSPPRQRRGDGKRLPTFQNARGGRGGRGNFRGRGGPRLAADRDFLKTNREPTPDLMTGLNEDDENAAKYIAPADVSDSEEEDMDISDDDGNDSQGPKKKQARNKQNAIDGDSVPRWSNPDPYTALPPPDESRGKKKDVVKLIRKARIIGSSEHASKPAATDDFISFDFGDDEAASDVENGVSVQGAPTGPREASGSANQVMNAKPAAQVASNKNEHSYGQHQFTNNSQVNNAPRGPASQTQQSLQPPSNAGKETSFQIKSKANPPTIQKKNVIDLTSDPNLSSRKRTFNDEIKNLKNIKAPPNVHDKNAGKPGKKASGAILPSWRPSPQSSSSPWLGIDHSDSANMGVWLHKEIVDFYEYVKPRDFEQTIRSRLVEDLRSKVKTYFHRDDDIKPFGSFPAGLYLPTADMDLVCISSEFTAQGQKIFGQGYKGLNTFRSFLEQSNLPLNNDVECIFGAKVPLVKYVDRLTGLKVDISFENTTGIVANTTFQNWKKQFPAMPVLVTLIKHLLAMRGLNEPVNGGIGGFSVTCLVVSLLQNMPQVQSGTLVPEHHLGEILMEFLDLYGNQFNTATTAISLDPPGYMPKNRANVPYKKNANAKFMIIDPNRPDNDISGGSSNTPAIRKCFSDAYDTLQRRMGQLSQLESRNNESVLERIIGGNYQSFELQRAHLAHVYENIYSQ